MEFEPAAPPQSAIFSGRCGGSSPKPINRLAKSSLCHGQNVNIECSRAQNRFLTENLDATLERLHASRKIFFFFDASGGHISRGKHFWDATARAHPTQRSPFGGCQSRCLSSAPITIGTATRRQHHRHRIIMFEIPSAAWARINSASSMCGPKDSGSSPIRHDKRQSHQPNLPGRASC